MIYLIVNKFYKIYRYTTLYTVQYSMHIENSNDTDTMSILIYFQLLFYVIFVFHNFKCGMFTLLQKYFKYYAV